MNSSMLAGERRWASARRGGMTVLGKVAVPKPLNLPSQRLENHGLDPNVEIVPKGTLGWGSRPSSSGSNPWASSSLSPNAEGGTGSPNHLSGRPSSGGNGTRPSTAGSERTHEPVSGGAWGSNSRPSSASGTLSSNQTSSASVRPSSAENRPNSSQSQLSRFADPASKNSAAWSPNVTGERLGAKSSKEDGFSLTSGDFPTLGTEKDNSMKITEFEDHGRPSSASGRISHEKDDTRDQADPKHRIVNTWRADNPQGPEDDIHPIMEKWHGDNPQYFNHNAPPQHFDAWRGPPMNGPSGVWYGGRTPRGPPFGSSVGPGGFPMEPYPYYRPQIAPPPGTRGPHPKNGDLYRPQNQMPDAAYPRPGMPFRPGFYPRPMGFESFYGPPMGYERDMPYMRMSSPPQTVYNNSYPASDIGNSHSRDGRDFNAGKASLEQVEEAKDTQGPKRITLKSRNQCEQWKEGETREHNLQQPGVSYPEKSRLPIMASRKNEWGAEEDLEDDVHARKRTPNEKSEYRAHSADGVKVKSFEGTGNTKAVNDNWTNLPENAMPSAPFYGVRDPSLPNVMKKSDLMHKIDGLNAKICISDGRNDSLDASNREEVRSMSEIADTRINNKNREASNIVGSFGRTPASRDFVSVPREVDVSVGDKPVQPMIVMSRRPRHGGQVIVDHRGKGKFNSQDADAWRKKPPAESSNVMMASHSESHPHGPNNVEEASENSVAYPVAKVDGDSVETHDSIDIQTQRTKMRETAKQRIQQLQKEEEERTKEQRAKALAKLEELNRRSVAGEAGTEGSEKSQVINDVQDESLVIDGASMANHTNANQGEAVEEEMPRNLPVESDVTTNLPVQEDGSVRKSPPQYNDSRHKRGGYKQKQKSFTEKHVPNVAAANNDITSGEPNVSDERQRKKSNRSSKNKQKPDETEMHKVGFSETETMDSRSSVSAVIEPESVKDQQVLCSSLPKEESLSSKVSVQSRSHPSRRQQVNRKPHVGGDTAVWAPVNKAKVSVETSPESTNLTKGNNNNNNNNRLKGKRAEMERYVPKPVAKELAQQVYSPNKEEDMGNGRGKDQQRGPPDSSHTEVEIQSVIRSEGDAKGNQALSHWQPKSSNEHGNRNESLTLGELPREDVRPRNNRQNNRPYEQGPFNAPRDNRQSQNLQHGGPFKGNRGGRVEEANDGMGQRHRERGQRRGGGSFSRRQSGAAAAPAHVDSG